MGRSSGVGDGKTGRGVGRGLMDLCKKRDEFSENLLSWWCRDHG